MEEIRSLDTVPTPAFVVDMPALRRNAERLKEVADRSGAHILLAQKAFSCYTTYPELSKYLSGTTASGYCEARLGYEEMGRPFGKETHVYAPAFTAEDMEKLLPICDHIIFNSISQWKVHRERALSFVKSTCAGQSSASAAEEDGSASDTGLAGNAVPSFGLRMNPEYSEIETDIYNPCVTGSRLGILREELDRALGITGGSFTGNLDDTALRLATHYTEELSYALRAGIRAAFPHHQGHRREVRRSSDAASDQVAEPRWRAPHLEG